MNIDLDDERLQEWQDMQELVGLAWGLNHGSNVIEKIQKMERIAERLNHADFSTLRPSFLSWMNDVLIEKNTMRKHP